MSARLPQKVSAPSRTHEELLDGIQAQLFLFQPDLVRLRCESHGEIADRLGKGSGEQDDLRRLLRNFHDEAVGESRSTSARGPT